MDTAHPESDAHNENMIPPLSAGTGRAQRARGEAELVTRLLKDSGGGASGSTAIQRLYQSGCAKLRIPRAHAVVGAGSALQAVMINTSGGMTGGDDLRWRVHGQAETATTITTQACERVYKSAGGTGRVSITLKADAGAQLSWLPQETILFDNCSIARTIDVDLAPDAELLMLEPIVLGRGAMGEHEISGAFSDRWSIRRGGHLVHSEAVQLQGDISRQLSGAFTANGHTALATLLLVSDRAEGLTGPTRHLFSQMSDGATGGVSCWNGKLLARVLAKDSYTLRQNLAPLIDLLKLGGDESGGLPKIWAS